MKKTVAVLIALVAIMEFFAGCADNYGTSQNDLKVYYVNNSAYEEKSNYISSVDYTLGSGEDAVHNALGYLGTDPGKDNLKSALTKGTFIYSYSIEDNDINVFLSPSYTSLSPMEQTALKCCMTLTLCALKDINSVSIYVDGKAVETGLTPDMMIIADTDTNEFEKQLMLYFPDKNDNYLEPEYRVLTIGQGNLTAEYVIQELINGTQETELKNSIPDGTSLISIEVKEGLCTLNLSQEFVSNRADTAAGQRMTIYSIVDSLTHLDDVEKVRFLVEGREITDYEYISLSNAISRFDDIIYDPDDLYAEPEIVYLGLRGSSNMIETPVVIRRDASITEEEGVVQYLLSMGSVSGYESLIPMALKMNSISTVNRKCTIDFNSSLFSNGDGSVARYASYAIATSVINTGKVDSVTIEVDGEVYLQNIIKDSRIIVE